MTYPFRPINRWPNQKHHLRNIEIAIHVAQGNTFESTGQMFNMSKTRVNQIYRILMGCLCERYFPWVRFLEAAYDKNYYNHPARLKMISDYQKEYTNWTMS